MSKILSINSPYFLYVLFSPFSFESDAGRRFFSFFFHGGVGTGSYPPREKGLHRTRRHSARREPTAIPHSRTASSAYCEQVGSKRQDGAGLRGEMNLL